MDKTEYERIAEKYLDMVYKIALSYTGENADAEDVVQQTFYRLLVLLGKVMDLQMEKREFKTRNMVKAAVCAIALGLGLFGAGNGICYAATGESLVTKIKVVINGEETQQDIQWTQNGDVFHGEMEIYEDGQKTENGIMTEDMVEITVTDENGSGTVSVEKKDEVSANSSVNVDETE